MILRLLYYYFKTHYLRKRFKSRDQLSAYQEKRFKKLVKSTLCQVFFLSTLSG
ncbi:Uncharacterised protein [Legionella cherrii]|uniref:Uncharacterized protein n=1 Tax=Legionella cherrii TaxID=28084 RepID=A0ABY6T459_9GAMM|nr:Uncharacterised protein [Legionella cherrii]